MNRNEAKKIAETVTNSELKDMFLNAQSEIKDWTQRSIVNLGMTKGAAFNILSACIDKYIYENRTIHILAKTNMVREFGEYLTNYERKYKDKKELPKPVHQEPKFFPRN